MGGWGDSRSHLRSTSGCGGVDVLPNRGIMFSYMRDAVLTSFFTPIGPIVIAAWLLILSILLLLPLLPWLPFLLQYLSFQHVVIFAFLSLTGWCYLRFMWLKPSQHLRLGIQQVGTSQAFLEKSFQNNQNVSLCKYCPTQLSALKFLPWMLNAFIHTLSLAYFCFCYITKRTNTLPWPLEMITELTYWHWAIVWTLILAPQFVVFAAVIRVRRFDPNSVQFYQP